MVWITAEDHGPHLGAYGDEYATTPVLDALAEHGVTSIDMPLTPGRVWELLNAA